MTGIILAGGKSRRMGRDKIFLEAGGVPLFDRVYEVLKDIFSDLIVVANNPEPYARYSVRVAPDAIPNKGALGGLYTGLKEALSYHSFCFASDMPFLNPKLIVYLTKRRNEADVIIPKTGDGLQTLHAIYSKACLKPIEALISRGGLKIIDFFGDVTVKYVSERGIRRIDPDLMSFININTEADLARAEGKIPQDQQINE